MCRPTTLATVCPRFITVRVIAVAMHVTRATHLPSLALHLLKLPPDVGWHRVQVVVAAAAVGPCGWPRWVWATPHLGTGRRVILLNMI